MGQTRVTWQRLLDARSNVNTAFILAPASAGSTPWADKLPWQQLQLSDGLPPTKPDLHPHKRFPERSVMSVYNKACGPQVGFCLFSFMGPVLGDNSPPVSSCLGRHNCHVFLNIFSSVCTIPVDTGEPFSQQPLLPRADTTKLLKMSVHPLCRKLLLSAEGCCTPVLPTVLHKKFAQTHLLKHPAYQSFLTLSSLVCQGNSSASTLLEYIIS